jgi:type IV pilus assembly protein PilE
MEKDPVKRHSFQHHVQAWGSGYSLVEIMLVLGLLGIILSLATPGYHEFRLRSHRTVAIAKLIEAAGCQERIRATRGRYDTAYCLPQADSRYRYRFEPASTPGTATFTVFAEPQLAGFTDKCGALTLDQDGSKGIGDDSMDRWECWSGR